jgi:chemotaxis protein methyltransferase CheR
MNPTDFDTISRTVRERSGLVLTPDKTYLIESRLAPVARRLGLASIEEIASAIRLRADEKMIAQVVDAMTTNETFFFRDKTPFETLEKHVLPDLIARRPGKPLRIWCAAASTGQEPYSIAMLVDAMASRLNKTPVEIIATDISDRCLEKARAGVYTQFEVQRGLPVQMLLKHFEKQGELWKVKDNIRAMVRWRTANLLENLAGLGRFDVVFCRNVLIYFDAPTKKLILERAARQLEDPGFLFLGAAETVLGVTDAFKPSGELRGLYVKGQPSVTAARAVA